MTDLEPGIDDRSGAEPRPFDASGTADPLVAADTHPAVPADRPLPYTHAALGSVDPWGPPLPPPRGLGAILWPWGLRGAAEMLEVIGLALLMFAAVRFGAQNYIVEGASMNPTFHQGEMVIVNKLVYRSFDVSWVPGAHSRAWRPFGGLPRQGDVVIFKFPNDPRRDFIKRVVAVPGQTVEVRNRTVYVDGHALTETYISAPPEYEYELHVVPPNAVFVLGDNRNNSFDSHSWGMLDMQWMIGRADLRYWPPGTMGLLDHTRPVTAGAKGVPTSP